ncbi:MAG: thiol:disulfide interchange protein DsbA/DsbL [Steroidobacteraceae bacterium]
MKKALPWIGLAALLLAACGSPAPESKPAPEAPAPAAQPSESQTPAPSQAELDKAATATQESSGDAADDASDASLERLAALPENAQLPAGRWKSGVNYRPIVPSQPTSAEPGQVEVIEVFWLGCGHCYALEPFIESWKKNKADYIKFTMVPVMWGPVHRAHGRLYYTLEALGRTDLVPKAFDEIHKRGNMLVADGAAQSQRLGLEFAKANGISEADFNREYNGFSVNTKLQRAEEITRRYRVEGVPSVYVNGKYMTDVGLAGGQKQLVDLINDLAAFEKRR